VCRTVLEGEGVDGAVRLALHLVDDAAIAELNATHRGLDRPTDVLSFPLVEREAYDRFALPPAEPLELGDIVISYPRVLAQAAEFGHSPERELGFLTAHGLLHILGHDHEEPGERARMREREEAALTAVGLSR
jgi:probable rRNA maturation factor